MTTNTVLGFSMDEGMRNEVLTDKFHAMQRWLGKRAAIYNTFATWWGEGVAPPTREHYSAHKGRYPHTLAKFAREIWSKGAIPMVTWADWGSTLSGDSCQDVADGKFEQFFQDAAQELKRWIDEDPNRRIYIRLCHEMNIEGYRWSRNPDSFVRMWRYLWNVFNAKGFAKTNLQWVWCVNNEDYKAAPAERFYPGAAFVDWLGIDGYNWGADSTWADAEGVWRPAARVFDGKRPGAEMLGRIRRLARDGSKPIGIQEVGTTSSHSRGRTPNVAEKERWVSEFFQWARDNDLRMVCWFNNDKECDWEVFGGRTGSGRFEGHHVYNAFREAIGASHVAGALPGNPRILTDELFLGRAGAPTGPQRGEPLPRQRWSLTASSSATNEGPERAIDGNLATRWSLGRPQNGRENQWFTINLGAPQTFRTVELNAGRSDKDYPREYILKGSNDARTWTELQRGRGTGPLTTIQCATPQTWQYIGIAQVGSDSFYWWSIHDLNVYR